MAVIVRRYCPASFLPIAVMENQGGGFSTAAVKNDYISRLFAGGCLLAATGF